MDWTSVPLEHLELTIREVFQSSNFLLLSTDNEVFYMDCTSIPLEHLELTILTVFQSSNFLLLSTDNEVFYMDCTSIPLEHLELTIREVFLPLLGTNTPSVMGAGINGDKLMDILQRLMAAVEVSQGHVEVSWGWLSKSTGTCRGQLGLTVNN